MYNIYHICLFNGTVLEVQAKSEKEALRLALYPIDIICIFSTPYHS